MLLEKRHEEDREIYVTPEHVYGPEERMRDYLERTYKGRDTEGYIKSSFGILRAIDDPEVVSHLVDKFTGNGVNPESEKKARNYFEEHSFFAQVIRKDRGSHIVTETLYENGIDPEEHPIDYAITKMPSAQATKYRLKVVEDELERVIRHAVDEQNKAVVNIANWGSGPGRDTTDVAKRLKDTHYGEAMRVTNIDKDDDALEKGEMYARDAGVYDKITFEKGKLGRIVRTKGNGEYDVGVVIGILCPFAWKETYGFVKGLSSHISDDGGCLMASTSSPEMLKEDPYLDFIRVEEGFWPLNYKGETIMKAIYRLAGFWGDLHTYRDEPWGHHLMLTGYKRNGKNGSGQNKGSFLGIF